MCGIFGIVKQNDISQSQLQLYVKHLYELYKRGPDQSAMLQIKQTLIGFTRLSIMDLNQDAMQPYTFDNDKGKLVFICNGEIYNFKDLVAEFDLPAIQNKDCKVIPLLYMKLGLQAFTQLLETRVKGEFAFAIFEYNNQDIIQRVTLGRDMMGIRPLYISSDQNNKQAESLVFASNIHALSFYQGNVSHYEPGTITQYEFASVSSKFDQKHQGYKVSGVTTLRFDYIYTITPHELNYKPDEYYIENIRNSLIQAVKIRLNADQPICFLLSGGLDSSLICAIAQSLSDTPINTFCCGMALSGQKANTNDIINARKVAEFIGSNHTEVTFTEQEAIDAIPKVIKNIGTWCQTTIRAATPMYLLCKYIKDNTPFKVVFTGEASDELFQGYLFNYEIPTEQQIEISTHLMIKNIHKYDALRADGCISQNSLESRVPFSDSAVVQSSWELPSSYKHPRYKDTEKYWLRQAFKQSEHQNVAYLPDSVLFRTKVAFSNSIADTSEKTWIQIIKEYCTTQDTNELNYYKNIFTSYFGDKRINILDNHWQPHRFDSKGHLNTEFIDSSAEVLDIYKQKFNTNNNNQ